MRRARIIVIGKSVPSKEEAPLPLIYQPAKKRVDGSNNQLLSLLMRQVKGRPRIWAILRLVIKRDARLTRLEAWRTQAMLQLRFLVKNKLRPKKNRTRQMMRLSRKTMPL